jgi:peptide/nickel transport system substrate-binding protein
MKDVRVRGKYAIQFNLAQPVDIFLMEAALSHRAIYDSKEMRKHATSADPYAAKWGRTGDAGFGKWKVTTFEPGNQAVLQAFPGVGGAPAVKQIVLKEVPSSSDRVALLSRGSGDVAYLLAPREYDSLAKQKGVNVWNFPSINIALYQLDPKFPPLDKVEVRQALAYAAPYDAVVKNVYLGFATRAGGPIPKIFPGHTDVFSKRYTTDLEKAKALLQKAGVSGFSTTIGYDSENPVQEQMAILYQTNLDQIGVKAQLKGMTHAAWTQEQTADTTAQKLPITTYIDGPFVPHPYYGLYLNFYSKSPNNWSQVDVPGLDALLAKMIKTPSFSQVIKQAIQAQRMIAQDVPWIFVAEPGVQVATRDYVKNVGLDIAYLNYETFKVQ